MPDQTPDPSPDTDRPPDARPARTSPRLGRALAIAAVAITGGLAVLLGGLWLALGHVTVPLTAAIPSITAVIGEDLEQGYAMRIGGAELRRGTTTPFAVALTDVFVTDAEGMALAGAPQARIDIRTPPILLGRVVPADILLDRPRFRLDAAGVETTGVFGLDAAVALVAAKPVFLARLPDITARGPIFVDGALDAATPTDDIMPELAGLTIGVETAADGTHSLISITGGAEASWRGWLDVTRAPDGSALVDAGLTDVLIGALDLPASVRTAMPDISSPISATASGRIDADGALIAGDATVTIGAGYVQLGDETGFVLDRAEIVTRWDGVERVLHIAPSRIDAGRTATTLSGRLALPRSGTIDYGLIPFKLSFDETVFAAGDRLDPQPIDAVTFDGIYVAGHNLLQIDRLDIATAEAAVSAAATVRWIGASPQIRGRASVASMPIDTLKRVWPDRLAPGAYDWIYENFHSGQIDFADVVIDLPSGALARADTVGIPQDAVRVDLAVDDAVFHVLGDVPSFNAPRAVAELDLRRFEVVFDAPGFIDLGGDGRLDIPAGRMTIDGVLETVPEARIDVTLAGGADDLFALMDYAPLDEIGVPEVVEGSIGGSAVAEIGVSLPMLAEVALEDTEIGAVIALDDLAMELATGDRDIQNGSVEIRIDGDRVTGAGRADVNGVEADISFVEPIFGGDAEARQDVTLTLDAAARERFGIDLSAILSGPVPAEVSDRDGRQTIRADLTGATLSYPPIGLDKPAGEAAEGLFQVVLDDDVIELDRLEIAGRGIDVRGRMQLSADGDVRSAVFARFALQPDDDMAITVRRADNGDFQIDGRGTSFDFRRILRHLMDDTDDDDNDEGLALTVSVGTARGFNGEQLEDLTLSLTHDGRRMRSLDLTARHPDGSPLRARLLTETEGAPRLRVDDDNAGALLRWLDVYGDIQGGVLVLDAALGEDDDTARGRLTISSFGIRDNDELQQLIRSAEAEGGLSPSGATGLDGRPNPSSVAFDSVEVDFFKGREQITLRNGALRGAAIGASFDGGIDTRRDTISLTGTYVPLYALNNMFGQLPIIGLILGGGQREGLVGITYRLAGALDDPTLTVNPLSLVTPGLFRNIFGFAPPDMSAGDFQLPSDMSPAPALRLPEVGETRGGWDR